MPGTEIVAHLNLQQVAGKGHLSPQGAVGYQREVSVSGLWEQDLEGRWRVRSVTSSAVCKPTSSASPVLTAPFPVLGGCTDLPEGLIPPCGRPPFSN